MSRSIATALIGLAALASAGVLLAPLAGPGAPPAGATVPAAAATLPGPAAPAKLAHPIVVELFQSQGCSSCPPANRNALAVADRPDVLVLSWQVTYWDKLGWKDTFADPAFTRRQYDYAQALGHPGVFTPQVVVNGSGDVVGIRAEQFNGALARWAQTPAGPAAVLQPGAVQVSGAGTGPATVTLVRYDPKVVQVPIGRGENAGATLPHRNVVREVATLGSWTGGTQRFALPPARFPGLKTAVLVQQDRIGPVLALARD